MYVLRFRIVEYCIAANETLDHRIPLHLVDCQLLLRLTAV